MGSLGQKADHEGGERREEIERDTSHSISRRSTAGGNSLDIYLISV